MDTEELTLAEKCENMMNIVVESRRHFGKMCADYDQKTSLIENKLLDLEIKTVSNCRHKTSNSLSNSDVDMMSKDNEDFTNEIFERNQRIEKIKKNIADTSRIVSQLKMDKVGEKMQRPLTAEVLLTHAKKKQELLINSK